MFRTTRMKIKQAVQKVWDCDWSKQNKFFTRTRMRVKGFHNWLKLQPCFLNGGDHWIKKGVIIYCIEREGGKIRTVILKMLS